jgi:hypothetical protein
MSTIFTRNYDSPATTIPVADSVIPCMTSGGVPGTVRHDQLTALAGKTRLYNVGPGNLGALTAIDTNGRAGVANTMWFSDVYVPYTAVLLGIGVLNGTTVGTTKAIVSLYNAAGTLVANSSVTGGGAVTAGASVFQQRAFVSAYTAKPGQYWIGVMPDSTTDTWRTIQAATWVDTNTGTVAGVAATATPTITPTTTFTASLGILSYVYTA